MTRPQRILLGASLLALLAAGAAHAQADDEAPPVFDENADPFAGDADPFTQDESREEAAFADRAAGSSAPAAGDKGADGAAASPPPPAAQEEKKGAPGPAALAVAAGLGLAALAARRR